MQAERCQPGPGGVGPAGHTPAEAWTLQAAGTAVQIALPAAPGQGRALWVQPSAEAAPDLPRATPADWAWAELESGIAWVRGATVEAFVPQMINLELVGGVSFKKGCYPGQEVVARSQYRGTLKRRLQLFETDADVAVGDGLFTAADPEQPAGLVAGVARRDGVSPWWPPRSSSQRWRRELCTCAQPMGQR